MKNIKFFAREKLFSSREKNEKTAREKMWEKESQKSWKKSWGEKKSGSKKNVIKKLKKKWG